MRWTSRTSSTAGVSASTRACTAQRARSSQSAFKRSGPACERCHSSCPTPTHALSRAFRAQPYLRFDRNDYSLHPRLVGRRVEVRVSQAEISAVALDTGELLARHARVFAGGLCFTDPAHQAALDELRGARRRAREPAVEQRSLARYDQLIPA